MTVDASIQRYAAAMSESAERSDSDLIALLESSGIDKSIAERTVRFAPVAFCRALLTDMGITLSDDFLRFDGDGNLVHSGKLSLDDVFVASVNWVVEPRFDKYGGAQVSPPRDSSWPLRFTSATWYVQSRPVNGGRAFMINTLRFTHSPLNGSFWLIAHGTNTPNTDPLTVDELRSRIASDLGKLCS